MLVTDVILARCHPLSLFYYSLKQQQVFPSIAAAIKTAFESECDQKVWNTKMRHQIILTSLHWLTNCSAGFC